MRYRSFLIGLIVASLAVATSSSSHAKKYKRLGPQVAIPGGPPVIKLPDLVVHGISMAPKDAKCSGNNIGTVPVAVTIRNTGFGTAVMDSATAHWFNAWSVIGANFWNPLQPGGTRAQLKELKPGSFKIFNMSMAVKALVAPDNSTSSIGIIANVNPERVITESNYDNNTFTKQSSVKGVFCP